MNKSESISELMKAVVKVMADVSNIEKNLTVGTGISAYKGVSDKDVKEKVGSAMEKNGLAIFTTKVEPSIQIDRWEEDVIYNGNTQRKTKQQAFTEVKTNYILAHTSGEWIELAGYGQGVDTQDKGAGKATTYALKNILLYTFMIPTGTIDDSDNEHSDSKEVPRNINQANSTQVRR